MQYVMLTNTDLKVSRLCLGTGTLGTRWGPHWVMSERDAERAISIALDLGVNFFDTANIYNAGESETWLGRMLTRVPRDQVIISTKFGYRYDQKNPNSGGSHRCAMHASVERSLQRLGSDYIDLLYLHLWDGLTQVEETVEAAVDLIRAGKIRYFGLSNVPGWYAGYVHSTLQGVWQTPLAAVQLNINLLVREPEAEFFCFARHSGVPIVAWGPLANGLLCGRYSIDLQAKRLLGEGRLNATFGTGTLDPFQRRVVHVLEVLHRLSAEHGQSPAVLSIAWLLRKAEISSVVLGFSRLNQLVENLNAAEVLIHTQAFEALDAASALPVTYPYSFLEPDIQKLVHG